MRFLPLALLSGLLFALSLPPYNWEWLGWGAFVPLLLAALGRRPLPASSLLLEESEVRYNYSSWQH